MPRRLDAATEEALELCTCTLLVVPAEVRAVAAAARVALGLTAVAADVRVVVRGPSPSGLGAVEVSDALGLPVVAEMDSEPHLDDRLDRGEPPAQTGRGTVEDLLRRGARRPGISHRGVGGVTEVVADSDLLERVRSSLAAEAGPPTPARLAAALRSEGAVLGDAAVLEVGKKQLRSEISGAGPLEALLREPGVTDVLVNCPDEVWVDRGAGLERSPVRLRDEAAVRGLAQRLAAAAGRRLDGAAPFVDVRLPGGTRLHAVLPPISPAGTVISLRVPAATSFGLAELTNAGTVPADLLPLLIAVVRSRVAFLITGGTGSGKTTVLGALLAAADPSERIVLVEDTAELHPAHPHVVRLEARAANIEGVGRIGLDDLVRQALRMRPDRLVVGEVRGAEVVDLLAALNTGHEGGCGTLHANSAADVPARLEALGVSAGLRRDAVHAQAVAALDVVVHLIRERSGHRRVGSIDLLSRSATGELATVPGLMLQADGGVVGAQGRPPWTRWWRRSAETGEERRRRPGWARRGPRRWKTTELVASPAGAPAGRRKRPRMARQRSRRPPPRQT